MYKIFHFIAVSDRTSYIIRAINTEHVARMAKMRYLYEILIGKPEGKRQIGKTKRGWEDNMKMDVGEIQDGLQ
jgi:hypothetical protein